MPVAIGLWLLCTSASAQDAIELSADAESVPRYSKVEFTLAMASCPGSPFDPGETDVRLEITAPDGEELTLPCYYGQDYERRRIGEGNAAKDWLYPVGESVWKARFAPTQLGRYTCRALRRCRGETSESSEATFECTPSDSKGFVRVSTENPRYFEFSEDGPCFLIGENLAFVKDLSRHEGFLRKLGAGGGNFARIWACCIDWGMSVQGPKSAWGRSWAWDAPIAPEPGLAGFNSDRLCVKLTSAANPRVDVAPSHPVAVRPDTGYVLTARARTNGEARLAVELSGAALGEPLSGAANWTDLRAEFTSTGGQWWLGQLALRLDEEGTAWVSDLSLREAAGGPELLWEADVNRRALSGINLLDAYLLDAVVQAAEEAGVHLQLVLLPRDPYWEMHPSLKRGGRDGPDYDRAIRDGRNLLRYAVARWGYSTSVGVWEYFNEIDPASPTDRFYDELGAYLEEIDIYHHPRATSAWGPSRKDWRHPRLDAINLHHYLRPVDGDMGEDEVAALFEAVGEALAFEDRKPTLMAEFGLADDRWGVSPHMKQDADLVHIHNASWAAALSGLAGTVMPWWWDELDAMDVYRLYRPLADFVADIPYTADDLEPVVRIEAHDMPRVVGLRGEDCACLWIANPKATWHTMAVEQAPPGEIREATVEVGELPAGTYAIEWWDTRTGEVIRGEDANHAGGVLPLTVPAFSTDIACKVQRRARQGAGEASGPRGAAWLSPAALKPVG